MINLAITESQKYAMPMLCSMVARGQFDGGVFSPSDGAAPYRIIAAVLPDARVKPSRWGNFGQSVPTSKWDGLGNTQAILHADPSNVIARFMVGLEIDGDGGFYWPAIEECRHLYESLGALIYGFSSRGAAWSSTQPPDDPSGAYVQTFDDGYQNWDLKDSEFGAVAVRRLVLY